MILDDFFADGQAEAGAVRLAVRGEGLEQLVRDFRGNAGAGVLDFDEDFAVAGFEPQKNLAAFVQKITGVADEIVKNTAQPAGVKRKKPGGRLVFQHEPDGLGGRVLFQIRDQFQDEIAEIAGPEVGAAAAFGEDENVGHQVVDALHLAPDAGLDLVAGLGIETGIGKIFRRQADDAQRIFQVVDDAARKIADDGEAFGLEDFAEVEPVEFAEAVADLLEQGKGQAGRALDEGQHLAARQEINPGFLRGGSGGRARAKLDDGHLAENFTLAKPGKNPPGAGAGGNFHQPVFHEINAVAGRALAENFLAGGEAAFLGDALQRLQLGRIQVPEQRVGCKRGHMATL